MKGLLTRWSGWLLNQVRVNRVEPAIRDGLTVFVKRRRVGGGLLTWFGNRLLAWSDSGMQMLALDEWRRWEAHCFSLLYPDVPAVGQPDRRSLELPQLPGTSLRTLLDRDEGSAVAAILLAAQELRRAHGITCDRYQARWSHGDLHLGNILCDRDARRAYILDFDIRHDPGVPRLRRQALDLQAVVLELVARPDARWLLLTTTFLEAYEDREVLDELRGHLTVPRGWRRLLFHVKTNGAPLARLRPRLEAVLDTPVLAVTRPSRN